MHVSQINTTQVANATVTLTGGLQFVGIFLLSHIDLASHKHRILYMYKIAVCMLHAISHLRRTHLET